MMRKWLLPAIIISVLAIASYAQPPASHWATLDGNKIHYYDTGNAKAKNAIVLIHGWSCNADFWKESYNAFPDHRVLSVDLLGHGKSDKPEVSYSMELFAKTVNAVMENAKVKRAVLVGHSMGTPVARQFYKLFPKKTIAVVAVDMPLLPFGTAEDMKKFAESVTSNYPQGVEKFVTDMAAPVPNKDMRDFIRSSMLAAPKHVAVSAMNEIFDIRNWGRETIDVPVLVIAANSPMWKPTEADFKPIAPKAEVQVWSDVSHFLMMERPALFNGQVKGFILRNKLLP